MAFQGEVEYRRGRFEQAETLYRSALRSDDRTARAHFGLGKLALARMKTSEAIRSFNKAIELDPREPLYHFYIADALTLTKKVPEADRHYREYLKLNPMDPDRVPMVKAALDISSAFSGVRMGEVDAPGRVSPIPLHRMSLVNFMFVDVLINGKGPYRFIVDTGATQTVLSSRVAASLGLRQVATNIMYGLGGEGKTDSPVYRVDTLKVGDVTIRDVPLGSLSNPLLDLITDGILGPSLLADFAITIDYPRAQMELARKAPEAAKPVPVWCFGGLLLVPVEVNGKWKGNFLIDSGADGTLLSHSMANTLGIYEDTPGARIPLPIGGVGGLENGVLQVPSVNLKSAFETRTFDSLMAIDLQAISALIQTELSGVLGHDTLEDYRLTIDYSKAEIRLSK
jgi:predicted aspartyl protease